jgi:cell division protein FtsB
LGGTDEKSEGVWEWITGEAWKFTKWAANEPNNLGDEDFLQTWGPSLDGNRAWNDNQFDENRNGYILEYGYYSNPNSKDSDGDGIDDGKEVLAKTDPNNPLSRPMPKFTAPKSAPGAPPSPDFANTINDLNEKVLQQSIEIQNLQEDNVALKNDKVNLTDQIETLNAEVTDLKEENESLNAQINNLHFEHDSLRYDLETVTKQAEEAVQMAQVPFINGWVYDNDRGWIFTDADHYPLVYTHKTDTWHYFELGSNPRYFFNFKSQQWESWDNISEENDASLANKDNL